jgi:hypothetical protein
MIAGTSEKIGSQGNDSLSGLDLEIVYGLQGNDTFAPGRATAITSEADPIFVGGQGRDRYIVNNNFQSILVFDAGNSDGDVIEASGIDLNNSNTAVIEYFDRSLYIFDTFNQQYIFILDWKNPEHKIEEFRLENQTLSYDEFVANLQTSGKYVGNFTSSQTVTLPNGEEYDIEVGDINLRTLIEFDRTVFDRAKELENSNNSSSDSLTVQEFLQDSSQYIGAIRDFDGNDLGSAEGWKSIGDVDIQGDGDTEYVFVNPIIGRWASVGADSNNLIDFTNYGQGGDTRVVGIYIDPLVESGEVVRGSAFDSQRRFQNDLYIDNLTLLAGDDYDGNGLQETYFRVNDGTAVLHAYMHADGNIQYANYQSEADLEQFMTANGIDSSVWGDWLN